MEKEFTQALAGALLAQLGNVTSEVTGRRNWVIRTYDDKAQCGGFGQMERCGMLGAFLRDMAKHGICWRYFTYKKDWLEAMKAYKEAGYQIVILNG